MPPGLAVVGADALQEAVLAVSEALVDDLIGQFLMPPLNPQVVEAGMVPCLGVFFGGQPDPRGIDVVELVEPGREFTGQAPAVAQQ